MNTKIFLAGAGGILLLGVLPVVGYAAYNDVTLGTVETQITTGGVTLTLSGPGAALESITVNEGNFSVTMPGQSYIKIRSADRRNITTTVYAPVKLTSSCTASESAYYFESPASAPSIIFTVTVDGSTCTTGGSLGGGGSPGGSGGGGGGGASAVSSRAQKIYPDGTRVYLDEPGATAKIAELDAKFAAAAKPAAKAAAPAAVSAAPAAAPAASAVSALPALTKVLSKGSTGVDVLTLQKILNRDADTRVSASGAGSPGGETTLFGGATARAVQKFQEKYGIAKAGDEGYGVVGPKTRAKLNEIARGAVQAAPAVSSPATAAPAAPAVPAAAILRSLKKGADNADVKTLQQVLNSDPDTRVAESGVGSPGNETTYFGPATLRALKKFQEKYDIAQPGDDGYGLVGPKTRAKVNSMLGGGSGSSAGGVQKQIDDALQQIKVLQDELKKSSGASQ